jgi:Dolichyl-phosphate-mannose-protein mannosyltransferase
MEQGLQNLYGGALPTQEDRAEPVWQIWLFRWAVGLFIVSRVVLAWHQTIGSDEPQHAHVAWAWVHGLVQYRDIFDNHTPLFHLVSAPLVALIGERADILALLRCSSIGFNLITLFLVQRVCASLFSAQAGRLAVIGLAFFPPFYIDGAEFRTDVLWTTLWLAWIALVTSETHLDKRCFWGGLLLAACFAVSLKSVLLLLTVVVAFAVALACSGRFRSPLRKMEPLAVFKGTVLAFSGFAIFAASLLGLFVALGAGPAMYRCVIEHNLGGDEVDFLHRLIKGSRDPRFWFFLPALYFVLFSLGKQSNSQYRSRVAFVVLFVGLYPLLLLGGWPVVTGQDFLPYYPLLFVCLAPLVVSLWKYLPGPIASSRLAGLICLAVLFLAEVGWNADILHRKRSSDPISADRIGEVLRLTKPGETVLDPKGDIVLRPRPIYDVLELFTMAQYRGHILTDHIPEQLIAHHTMVAVRSDRYPERTRRFLQENFIWSGRLLIAGFEIPENAGGSFQFHLSLGGTYVFLSNGHLLSGKLNGVSIRGKAEMQPGFFEFVPDTGDWPVSIQWERAYQLGIIGNCTANLPWHGTRPENL